MDSPFTNAPATDATGIGADATSFYDSSSFGAYSALVTGCEGQWTSQAAFATSASLGFIPTAVTGWDRRPEYQNPASFTGNPFAYKSAPTPFVGMLNTTLPGMISQIASHVGDAVTFVGANAAVCVSTALLLCAWNECAEEGSPLEPSIGDPLQAGNVTNILTAIGAVLN
jgi:hypothetical protein